jgi:hypothetical protein
MLAWQGAKAREYDQVTAERDEQRRLHDTLRKQRLEEFMRGFRVIGMKLKEMYQMITLGGDAELELLGARAPHRARETRPDASDSPTTRGTRPSPALHAAQPVTSAACPRTRGMALQHMYGALMSVRSHVGARPRAVGRRQHRPVR